jgi:hypothetical protein
VGRGKTESCDLILRQASAVNILWVKTAFTIEDFANRHLADLQTAAREIVDSLREANKYEIGAVVSELTAGQFWVIHVARMCQSLRSMSAVPPIAPESMR